MPPLEAFALGCPVIASNVEGAAEQYGEAAMLVDPSDPEEIGRALASVMSDGDVRNRLIAAGRERAIRWTTSNYVGQIFRVLDEFSAIRRNWT
jgi:glycosyltransferase involved in cell wall biosynthesis